METIEGGMVKRAGKLSEIVVVGFPTSVGGTLSSGVGQSISIRTEVDALPTPEKPGIPSLTSGRS